MKERKRRTLLQSARADGDGMRRPGHLITGAGREEVLRKGEGEEAIFGDFGVSFVSTVAGSYTRWGRPRLSVRGEPLMVLTRGP